MKLLKKAMMPLCCLCIILSFAGCSGVLKLLGDSISSDNPLSGKDTDERILICLEETYPGNSFHMVEPFDKAENFGLYADQNGREFSVHNILYDNIYHFGCTDEYLAEILREQSFPEKVKEIARKHSQEVTADDEEVNFSLVVSCEEGEADLTAVAETVLEILNSVEIPEVVLPENQGFSTGEINYYTYPNGGKLFCDLRYRDSRFGGGNRHFSFEDKDCSVSEIEQRLTEMIDEVREEEGYFSDLVTE